MSRVWRDPVLPADATDVLYPSVGSSVAQNVTIVAARASLLITGVGVDWSQGALSNDLGFGFGVLRVCVVPVLMTCFSLRDRRC